MSYHLCHFQRSEGKTYWEKLYLLEFTANFLGGALIFVPMDVSFFKG
jgi:hypothetical protein